MLNNLHIIDESLGALTFFDSYKTVELKTAACSEDGTDLFFFRHGLAGSDEIDSYFDAIERLGLIYISRNREKMIIRNNKFY